MMAFNNLIDTIDLSIESQSQRSALLHGENSDTLHVQVEVDTKTLLELRQIIITTVHTEESINIQQLFDPEQISNKPENTLERLSDLKEVSDLRWLAHLDPDLNGLEFNVYDLLDLKFFWQVSRFQKNWAQALGLIQKKLAIDGAIKENIANQNLVFRLLYLRAFAVLNAKRSKVQNLKYSYFPKTYNDADYADNTAILESVAGLTARVEAKTKHSEVLWQLFKLLFQSLSFQDSDRNWQGFLLDPIRRNLGYLGEDKQPVINRFLREICIPVIASSLASGRAFLGISSFESMKSRFEGSRMMSIEGFRDILKFAKEQVSNSPFCSESFKGYDLQSESRN